MSLKEIDHEGFESEVLKSEQPVLVVFSANWCKPCKVLTSKIDYMIENGRPTHKLKAYKVNVDLNQNLSLKYNIKSIPFILLFQNGVPFDQIGSPSVKRIQETLKIWSLGL